MMFLLLAIFNLISIFSRDVLDYFGGSAAYVNNGGWLLAQYIISLIYLLEWITITIIFGFKNCYKTKFYWRLEIVFQIIIWYLFVNFVQGDWSALVQVRAFIMIIMFRL